MAKKEDMVSLDDVLKVIGESQNDVTGYKPSYLRYVISQLPRRSCLTVEPMDYVEAAAAKGLSDHFKEAKTIFNADNIIVCALQGSQNYGLANKNSDVDSKVLVTPTFKDVALLAKPASFTHVRHNEEHIDFKDCRLYLQLFRKQNINFLEILFTRFSFVNERYQATWQMLLDNREAIARMNPYRALSSMKGIAEEKFHAFSHPYPSKIELIEKYGYDGKQLHHICRVENFMSRFIQGESYEDCLIPSPEIVSTLLEYKMNKPTLEQAQAIATKSMAHIIEMRDKANKHLDKNYEDGKMVELLQEAQYRFLKTSIKGELLKHD